MNVYKFSMGKTANSSVANIGIKYILHSHCSTGQQSKSRDILHLYMPSIVESNGAGYKFENSANFLPIRCGIPVSITKFTTLTTFLSDIMTQLSPHSVVSSNFGRCKRPNWGVVKSIPGNKMPPLNGNFSNGKVLSTVSGIGIRDTCISYNRLTICCNGLSLLRNKRLITPRKFSKAYAENEYMGPKRITSSLR